MRSFMSCLFLLPYRSRYITLSRRRKDNLNHHRRAVAVISHVATEAKRPKQRRSLSLVRDYAPVTYYLVHA